MRVLTVIATIFIPPTFLARIYGMNFDRPASPWNMPELGWSWGYQVAWAAMLLTMVIMLVYFKWKNGSECRAPESPSMPEGEPATQGVHRRRKGR
jgi:Mg2+ and Co2+ transporter CorA